MKLKRIFIFCVVIFIAIVGFYSAFKHTASTQQTIRIKRTTKSSTKTVTTKSNRIQVASYHRQQSVQTILNKYRKQKNIGIVYTDLKTGKIAAVNKDKMFYAASVAKLPIVAYVQHRIMTNKLSWETKLGYANAANKLPNAMVSGGTGTLQYEDHRGKLYTITNLMQRTIEQSDNQASNQLFYHVAHKNINNFQQYLQATTGTKTYSKTMSPMQVNRVIITIWQQKQRASSWLEQTNWAHDKIGTLPVKVAHKIGINGAANNDTAIVLSQHQFALTIMTNGWSDSQIANLAQKIYAVAK